MIRVIRPGAPAALRDPQSPGRLEIEEATRFFASAVNKGKTFEFKVYKLAEVVQAIGEGFNGKCAYCESSYREVQPADIEHYRPKGGYLVDRKLTQPGYYWLAADWMNLLPSCIDCNRARWQEEDDQRVMRGKATQFPIANEARRATSPGMERFEQRLLLHPCLDHPERHLEFIDEGIVRPALDARGREQPKGRASIDVYGLQRRGLREVRRDRWTEIQGEIERVRDDVDDAESYPALRDRLRKSLAHLLRQREADRPYAGMARQCIDPFIEDMRPRLTALLGHW